jgi:hypothetical protein
MLRPALLLWAPLSPVSGLAVHACDRAVQSSVRVKIVVKLVIVKVIGGPMDFDKVCIASCGGRGRWPQLPPPGPPPDCFTTVLFIPGPAACVQRQPNGCVVTEGMVMRPGRTTLLCLPLTRLLGLRP